MAYALLPCMTDTKQLTTESLIVLYVDACIYGAFSDAYKAANELSRRPREHRTCLGAASKFDGMQGYTSDQLQMLDDRIEQFNAS